MHIVLGDTEHVGSAAAEALLEMGEPVTIVTHDLSKPDGWRDKGAGVAVCDVHDTDALRRLFRQGKRLFLLNPPADPSTSAQPGEAGHSRSRYPYILGTVRRQSSGSHRASQLQGPGHRATRRT